MATIVDKATETPAQTQTLMSGLSDCPAGLGSRQGIEGFNGDVSGCGGGKDGVVVVTKKVVETEDSVERTVWKGSEGDTGEGLDNVYWEEKRGVQKFGSKIDSAVWPGGESNRKVYSENGISLVVEVSLGGVKGKEKGSGFGHGIGSVPEKGGVIVTDSVCNLEEKCAIAEGDGQKQELGATGMENEDDDGNCDDVGDLDHEYAVGDLVWGKIRSHPWWPGQIYDALDASNFASKRRWKDGCFLVVYFGDGSFSWCYPSQLKPFAEHFDNLAQQSNSKGFSNSVQTALDMMGKLVELEMTCPCIPEENRVEVARPSNTGLKPETLLPECPTAKYLIDQLEPAKLLASVRQAAQMVSISSVLDFTVLRSWLTAFYRAKGGYHLQIYPKPKDIEGLEDGIRSAVLDTADFSNPVEVPIPDMFEEDSLSSPVGPAMNPANLSLLQKCPATSHIRKRKSVATLMQGMDVDPAKRKRKRKNDDESGNQGKSVLTYPSGRKRERKQKASSLGNSDVEGEEANKNHLSAEWNIDGASPVEDDSGKATEEPLKISLSRERKKSKYLSPPYTNVGWRIRESLSKEDLETESERIGKITQMRERMTRVADQLLGSPLISECSNETLKGQLPQELDSGHEASGCSRPQTALQDGEKSIYSTLVVATTAKEVISKIRSAAVDPFFLTESDLNMMTGFILEFRSCNYKNGPKYKIYHKKGPGRKRKPVDTEPRRLNQTEHESLQQERGAELNEDTKMKKDDKEANKNDSPVGLLLTFPPGFSLPSKDDVIKMFSKFGALNEMETDVLYNSFSARIVFVRSSDAKEALSRSLEKNPFGNLNVNLRLLYPSGASRVHKKVDQKGSDPVKKVVETGVPSELVFMKRKLEMMSSMLGNCTDGMSAAVKSKFESELKGLLEKVSTMPVST